MPALSLFRKNYGVVSTTPIVGYGPRHSQDLLTSSSQHSTVSAKPRKSQTPSIEGDRVRRVTFLPDVQTFSTIHRSHYSEPEKDNTWITRSEMDEMKVERNKCMQLMGNCSYQVDDDIHYFRGLENKTVDGHKRRRFVIVVACLAVMDEQSDQQYCAVHDPDAISRVYKSCSKECADAARQRGIFDELAAIAAVSSTSLPLSEGVAMKSIQPS